MKKRRLKKSVRIILFILCFVAIVTISSGLLYLYLTSPVDKNSQATIEVAIKKGSSTKNIARTLKRRGLIKSEILFRIVAKCSSKGTLKASVYQFKKSMSFNEILDLMTAGSKYNPDTLRITFVEGENIKKYAKKIADKTNNSYDQVLEKMNNKDYLKTLINKYYFLSDEILNSNIYFPLEGYLMPNTYEFSSKNVSVEEIIEVMLDQTSLELDRYKEKIESSGKTYHEYLTLASMLELEGTNAKNRKMIAGVFYNRLNKGMNLGSDVTTYYGLQQDMDKDLTVSQFQTSNPYNTRAADMAGKYPVGPICNPSISSINASIDPQESDYLYFVADKNGNIYYTKTEAEHLKKVQEIKEAGDWIW